MLKLSADPVNRRAAGSESGGPSSDRYGLSVTRVAAAGERLEGVAELPRCLGDTGAGALALQARAAAVVALDGPERQEADALGDRTLLDGGGVRGGERLGGAEVVDAGHLGDADHGPQPCGGPVREQRVQLGNRARRRR